MNPYLIIGLMVAGLSLVTGGYALGNKNGRNAQAVLQQAEFDRVNATLTENKRVAANALLQAQADIIKLQSDRDTFKTKLGEQYAKNRADTDAIRDRLLNSRLQFDSEITGCWAGSGSTLSTSGNTAGNNASARCELPATITENLQQLTLDADRLRDDYWLLYNFNHSER